MAFYCELPNERICDIGWERLTCTEQWLVDQIREIQGYSREQRVRLGKECVNDVIRFLANMYKNDEAGTDSYLSLYLFAVGIACLNRTSATQAWKDEVVEVFHVLPEALENVIRPFDNGNPFTYQTVVATMAIFGTDAVRPIGSRYLQLCICIACADTPNVAAFDWIRKIHREYLLLLDRWNHALYAAALGGDRSEMTVEDDYQNEKPILPLREYRRQQRATERKKRQAELERKQKEINARRQREKDAEEAYDTALVQWEQQCATTEKKRSELCEQRITEEEKRLKNQADQRHESKSQEISSRLAEQEAVKKEAEQTLAALSVFKLVEKNRQKKAIQEASAAIEAAKAEQSEADAAYKRDLEESERQLVKLRSQFAKEAARTFPIPEKPQMSPDVVRRKAVGQYEPLCDWLISHFGNEKFKLVDAVDMLNQTGDVNRIPFLNVSSYGMSSQKFALILHTLEKNGIAEKRTDLKTRTVWYRIR